MDFAFIKSIMYMIRNVLRGGIIIHACYIIRVQTISEKRTPNNNNNNM